MVADVLISMGLLALVMMAPLFAVVILPTADRKSSHVKTDR